jgi:hypothetical protein
MILNCLTTAEFTLFHARGFANRGDTLNTVGCLTEIAFVLLQSLFALNSEYYFGDKGILEAIDRFPLQPQSFSKRLQHFLAMPMRTKLDLRVTIVFDANQSSIFRFALYDAQVLDRTSLNEIKIKILKHKGEHGS